MSTDFVSHWGEIFSHLKNKGFSVYSPGQHQGECTSPYTVVKIDGLGSISVFSSNQARYELLCYVPADAYSTLEPYVHSVKEAMKELYPTIVPMDFQTASFLDDTVRGHMISIQYRNNQKITRR